MDKEIYIAFIKYFENDETKRVIGQIDVEILHEEKVECLYYIFPLIEKMILEIFKLVPESDVEYIEQGIMKTPISIIENNDSSKVLPSYIIDIIKKYYKEDGPRNKLLHIGNAEITVNVSFNELLYLISNLLIILKNKLEEYTNFSFEDIKIL
jgi:hypothetical protein